MTTDLGHRYLRNKHTREIHSCEKATPACQIPDDPDMFPDGWEYIASIDDAIENGDGLCFKCIGQYAKR